MSILIRTADRSVLHANTAGNVRVALQGRRSYGQVEQIRGKMQNLREGRCILQRLPLSR